MSTKKKPISYKDIYKRQKPTGYKNIVSKTYPPNLNQKKAVPTIKSYKYAHRTYISKEANASNKTPSYVSKLREEYLKKGKLSNSHKKFLNLLSSSRVVKK
jgi:hypothetical protein